MQTAATFQSAKPAPVVFLPEADVDFETYSELDIKKVGAWVYAEHPSTDIICMAYKIGAGPTKLWVPDGSFTDFPEDLLAHIKAGGILKAFSAQFERAIFRHIITKKYGIDMPRRWICTQAICAYRSLPMDLDRVGNVLRLTMRKDSRGSYLISKLCKPQKPNKQCPTAWRCRDPELLKQMYEYCMRDVDTEYELGERLGRLPQSEYLLWCLDARINDRGVCVDQRAVKAAQQIITKVSANLTEELILLTGGMVKTANELDKMHDWFATQGYSIPSLEANVIEDALNGGMAPITNPSVRRVLQIRLALGRSSPKKLEAYRLTTAADGRVHGLLQYHGAGTGRWAGRLVQPQNFPRGDPKIKAAKDMELLIELIMLASPEVLDIAFGDCMECIAASLRGMIVAGPGNTFYVSDFAAIEARVTMWLAGQQDALDAFAAYDRGEGPDIYCFMASKIYGREIKKAKDPDERQLGKVTILGCGYQMGGPRLKEQAKDDYGIDLIEERATELVQIYRKAYPKVPELWYGLEEAAVNAVLTGKPHYYSFIGYEVVNDAAGKWLTCVLPNGRKLWYFNPRVIDSSYRTKSGDIKACKKLIYEGRDNKKGGAWGTISTYGGMLTENAVQAIARDLMAEAMVRVESAGYIIVLTVHDEIVAEVKIGFGNLKEYETLMRQRSDWAPGCPINVEGWTGPRYKKG